MACEAMIRHLFSILPQWFSSKRETAYSLFLTALLTITRIMNKINNREEMKYMCKVISNDEVKRAGANGTRGPMRGTAQYRLEIIFKNLALFSNN